MAAKESTKSSGEEKPVGQSSFYGLAEHPNNGILSSLLKRKGRRLAMTEDAKAAGKQVDAYKLSADRLHQALLFMLVENQGSARNLMNVVKTEPGYRYAAQYLKTFEHIQKQGRKGTYENLKPAIESLESLDAFHEKTVRRQLEILKPLSKFIGEDYWEYSRLRKVYWEALEAYDDAITVQNKERTEESERAAANAQTWRNECRAKLMEFIKRAVNEQKGRHADCVLKFRDEAIGYHRAMSELIVCDAKERDTSKMKAPSK